MGCTPSKQSNFSLLVQRVIKRLEANDPDFTSQCLDYVEFGYRYTRVDTESIQAIAKALENNTTLKKLYLGNNALDIASLEALAHALRHNTTLTNLHFGNNNIPHEGLWALVNALKSNLTLTTLSFRGVRLSYHHRLALCELLKNNTALTELDLSKCGLYGVRDIFEALAVNTSLKWLNLSENSLHYGDAETLALANALKRNTSLLYLNLSCNSLLLRPGSAGEKALDEALEHHNTTLTAFYYYTFEEIHYDKNHPYAPTLIKSPYEINIDKSIHRNIKLAESDEKYQPPDIKSDSEQPAAATQTVAPTNINAWHSLRSAQQVQEDEISENPMTAKFG